MADLAITKIPDLEKYNCTRDDGKIIAQIFPDSTGKWIGLMYVPQWPKWTDWEIKQVRTFCDVLNVFVEPPVERAPWRGEEGQWEDHVAFNEEQLWADG